MSYIVLPKTSVGNPTIKPPRWGTRSEVEFAVRANCERLGLPMPLAWSPMWGRDFGDTLVGSVRPSTVGYEIIGTNGALNYVTINVPAVNLNSAALFYVGNQRALALYNGLFSSDIANNFGISHMDADTDPVRIRAIFGGSAVSAWHYIAKSDFPLTAGGSWAWTGTCVGTKHSKISVGWPSQRVVRHSQTHSRSNFNLENPSQLRSIAGTGASGKTVEALYLWPTFIPDSTMDLLHYQPHLLLMPVKRRKYYYVPSVNHWELQLRVDGGAWVEVPNLEASVREYLVSTGLVSGSTYEARLRKYTNGVPSEWEVSNEVFYTTGSVPTDVLTGQNIETAGPVLTSPALGQTHALIPDSAGLASPEVSAPTVTQVHALLADSISTDAPTVATPSLSVEANTVPLTAQDILSGEPVIATPAIAQSHVLAALNLETAATSVGSPALSQAHALAALSVEAGAGSITSPELSVEANKDILTGQDVALGEPAISSPGLMQVHVLGSDGAALGAPEITGPAITQIQVLISASVSTAAPAISSPSMTPSIVLTAQDIEAGSPSIGTPAISQEHTLFALPVLGGDCAILQPALGQTHALLEGHVVLADLDISLPSLYNANFLPNPRISIPSKVAFRLICASRVQTSIVKKTSIGINVDTQ